MKTAVVLAAGRGSRMGALTAATPKPLLPVGGRSLLEHIVRGLAGAGVERVIVVIGYLGEQIEAMMGDGARFGVRIGWCRQERAEGTARALLLAEPQVGSAPFVLAWGDILVSAPFYRQFVQAFELAPCDAQLAVNEIDDPWRGAAVYVGAEWRVTGIEEKPPRRTATTHWNNAGIMILTAPIFDYARRLTPSPRGEYELPEAVAQMIRDGLVVRAVPIRGFWSDVGTPADLERARRQFA